MGKRVGDLKHNPENPRAVTDEKLLLLAKSLKKFGDLSGIVFNIRSGQLVGGHQRSKQFDQNAVIVYTQKFKKPTKTGTVALGYVEHNGEKYSYREVDWDEAIEKAANIAANKGAGEFDSKKLKKWFKDLSSFDVNIDLGLTMFGKDERKSFGLVITKSQSANGEEHEDGSPDGKPIPEKETQSKLVHECPRCGYEFR